MPTTRDSVHSVVIPDIELPLIRYRDARPLPCFVISRGGKLIACPTGFCDELGFEHTDYLVFEPGVFTAHRWELTPERLALRIKRCIELSRSRTRTVLQQIYPYQRAPIAKFDYPDRIKPVVKIAQ